MNLPWTYIFWYIFWFSTYLFSKQSVKQDIWFTCSDHWVMGNLSDRFAMHTRISLSGWLQAWWSQAHCHYFFYLVVSTMISITRQLAGLVVGPPLCKIWLRQLGWLYIPNISGKIKFMATKPPTSDKYKLVNFWIIIPSRFFFGWAFRTSISRRARRLMARGVLERHASTKFSKIM